MIRSIERRIQKLEKLLHATQARRKVATVIYDPSICSECDLPKIEANVILCLPNNDHRIPHGKPIPPEGYVIKYL